MTSEGRRGKKRRKNPRLRIEAFIRRNLFKALFQLQEQYQEIVGTTVSASRWVEMVLEKGLPAMQEHVRRLKKEQSRSS